MTIIHTGGTGSDSCNAGIDLRLLELLTRDRSGVLVLRVKHLSLLGFRLGLRLGFYFAPTYLFVRVGIEHVIIRLRQFIRQVSKQIARRLILLALRHLDSSQESVLASIFIILFSRLPPRSLTQQLLSPPGKDWQSY